MNSKVKAVALALTIMLPVILSGCSSESSKLAKACDLAKKGSAGIKADDPLYAENYTEAANILKDLAAKDSKYSEPYRAALLWASGDNMNYDDIKTLITLEKLCSPTKE